MYNFDSRIQEELEKLNCSTDVINKLEVDLEEARHTFRILMKESGQQLERLSKQSGASSVEKARPYYEARMRTRRAHSEAQRAAARFEKASNAHEAAKEMVALAEEGYKERGCLGFDQAWQEMLNHASSKGQIKSECIYDIMDFPKYHRKNLIDFCPGRFYRLGTCNLF